MSNTGMAPYTAWGIKFPWHVTKGLPVPLDCACGFCRRVTYTFTIEAADALWNGAFDSCTDCSVVMLQDQGTIDDDSLRCDNCTKSYKEIK